MNQVMCGHSLQNSSCSLPIIHALRNWHEPVSRNGSVFRIATLHSTKRNPVAGPDRLHIRANCGHNASAFLSGNERQREFVASFALVNVNEIHAGGGDLN